jgi:hypothetical protein
MPDYIRLVSKLLSIAHHQQQTMHVAPGVFNIARQRLNSSTASLVLIQPQLAASHSPLLSQKSHGFNCAQSASCTAPQSNNQHQNSTGVKTRFACLVDGPFTASMRQMCSRLWAESGVFARSRVWNWRVCGMLWRLAMGANANVSAVMSGYVEPSKASSLTGPANPFQLSNPIP